MCAKKGRYEDLTREILRHFESYGFRNLVIVQCEKEMSIIHVRRKLARKRRERTVFRFVPKTRHQSNGFCRSSVRTHTRARTMLPNTNRNEHWHALFSHLSCHSQFVTLDLCSRDSQCELTEERHSNIC